MSVAAPNISSLPSEVIGRICNYEIDLPTATQVCKSWKKAIDTTTTSIFWHQLSATPPPGPIQLKQLVSDIENEVTPHNYLNYLKELFRRIKTLYCFTLAPQATLSILEELQEEEQKLQDECLLRIWGKILEQYEELQLPAALKTAADVRNFLNNSEHAQLLHSIVAIDLSNLNLEVLPPEICRLSALQELNLQNNQLIILPCLSELTNLRVLVLQNNQLVQLPESFEALTQLEELYLAHNQLATLPHSFSTLTSLKVLNLFNNQLSNVPEAISRFTQLKTLLLNHNKLAKLPPLSDLKELEMLFLGNNELTHLPDSLSSLERLQVLSLGHNKLMSLPPLNRLTQLKTLSVEHNFLRSIPSLNNLKELQELSLDHNELSTLPSLSELTALELLNLNNNFLTHLPCLSTLPQLCVINLDHNFWMFIPNDVTKRFIDNPVIQKYIDQLNYKGQTSLGRFYQMVIKQETSTEALIHAFNTTLLMNDRHLIYEMVWEHSNKPSGDPLWGEHHAFDNMDIFFLAVQAAIKTKLSRLTKAQANLVYQKACELANRPLSEDIQWEELINHPALLADALELQVPSLRCQLSA